METAAALDAGLAFLAPYGPDLTNGMTSHAPMVIEALESLGRADAVGAWLERYRSQLTPRPAPREAIALEAWRAVLGREERTADWMALLRNELTEAPWTEVLARWVARLAPGFCASATHGVLRVAHAARSLARRETPLRRAELADALGAWAATYQTLPVPARRSSGRLAASEAIRAVPLQPAGERTFRGSIVSALAGLDGFAPFAPVVDLLDVSGPPERAVSALTRTFAHVYLANARDVLGTIVFAHGVTSAAAVRSLLPYLDAGAAQELLRYAWQAGAALYATFGSAPPIAPESTAPPPARAALAAAAVAHGDDHAIKLTEACLREHALAPDPVYLRVAEHALAALPPARS